MKIKKWLTLTLCLILAGSVFAGCSSPRDNSNTGSSDGTSISEGTSSSSDSTSGGSENSSGGNSSGGTEEGDPYPYDGTATAAPYKIYNADGTVCEDSQLGANSFENMFVAIKKCGAVATSKNKAYVKDANGSVIFQRQGNTKCWVYDGTHLVSNEMTVTQAKSYAEGHPRAYVVNGQGTAYVALGDIQYTDNRVGEGELFSGGYTYLLTPQGCASGSEWSGYSYAYGSAYVRLSECTYKDISESGGGAWNAYVFFNISSSAYNCDLGIGTYAGGKGAWKITQNCSHVSHEAGTAVCEGFYIDAAGNVTHDEAYAELASSNKFMVWQNYTVTKMTRGEDGVYSGADDLFLEAYAHENGWYVCVTNLRTNEKWGYTHTHEGMNTTQSDYMRVLLAASYCPVDGNLWNARDGGYLKNVVFEDVKVAKYQADGEYGDVEKETFFFGEDTIFNGFTQAADCANLIYGATDVAGVWKSGLDKLIGTKWFAFSSYYDGTHMDG